jgi:hypothetical protein
MHHHFYEKNYLRSYSNCTFGIPEILFASSNSVFKPFPNFDMFARFSYEYALLSIMDSAHLEIGLKRILLDQFLKDKKCLGSEKMKN